LPTLKQYDASLRTITYGRARTDSEDANNAAKNKDEKAVLSQEDREMTLYFRRGLRKTHFETECVMAV